MLRKRSGIITLLCLSTGTMALGQRLTIDPARSEVGFTVINFGVHSVRGRFQKYTGRIEYNSPVPERSTVHVVIQTATIDTKNAHRDKHLQSADFFEVAKYPELAFESLLITRDAAGYTMAGQLTIKGHTQPVTIPFTFKTSTENGKMRLNAEGQTKVNRHDFGLDYGSSFSVGTYVTIRLSVVATE
jgi:polyisoprenoid-binding protein YceI